MNFLRLLTTMGGLHFTQAVWLFPAATTFHFLEEAPWFAEWARKYASPLYTGRPWKIIHGIGLIYVVMFSAAASLFPKPNTVFIFFALWLTEAVYNTLFHLSATVWFKAYCPGLLTATAFYPVLFWNLYGSACREGLLSSTSVYLAVATAGIIHSIDVATSVYFVSLTRILRRPVSVHVWRP